jgi:murein L,D-transpeptidase YcbB/YkuD
MIAFLSHIFRFATVLTLAGLPSLFTSCKVDLVGQRNTDRDQADQFVSTADTCVRMPEDAEAEVYRNLRSPAVYEYYRSREFRLQWHEPEGSTPRAGAMIEVVHSVRTYGLLPQDYHAAEIEAIRNDKTCESRTRLDALLTDALFTMSSHVSKGRSKPVITDSTLLKGNVRIATVADIRDYLSSREPHHEGYKMLRSALTSIYDTLSAEDKQLLIDGVTSDSIPAQQLIKKVEINLERWRWEDQAWGPDYVLVNIPAFEVTVFRDDKEVIRSKAIVGSPRTPTPVFSSAIECLTVYPYWHVPRSIAVGEYLPAIKKNLSFIPLNNLEVLDDKGNVIRYDTLPWHTYNRNHFPVSLRQREGMHNALGVVKFQFDNPYSVLLHDTNAKGLYKYENRARSHGCIRMEKAIEFAHYLAENYTQYSAAQISGYLATKTMRRIDLERLLPIHVRYFTVAYDGKALKRYDDVYGRDRQLMNQFYHTSPVLSGKKTAR